MKFFFDMIIVIINIIVNIIIKVKSAAAMSTGLTYY
jgi:hypothetical protein